MLCGLSLPGIKLWVLLSEMSVQRRVDNSPKGGFVLSWGDAVIM